MQCPDCFSNIKDDSTACECGWKKPDPLDPNTPQPKPQCKGCTNDAVLSRKIGNRRVNLCAACDRMHLGEEAKITCGALGIHTADQAREWLRNNKMGFKRFGT